MGDRHGGPGKVIDTNVTSPALQHRAGLFRLPGHHQSDSGQGCWHPWPTDGEDRATRGKFSREKLRAGLGTSDHGSVLDGQAEAPQLGRHLPRSPGRIVGGKTQWTQARHVVQCRDGIRDRVRSPINHPIEVADDAEVCRRQRRLAARPSHGPIVTNAGHRTGRPNPWGLGPHRP